MTWLFVRFGAGAFRKHRTPARAQHSVSHCQTHCQTLETVGGINGRLENLKAVITHGRADGRKRRCPRRTRLTLLSGVLSVPKDGSDCHATLGFRGIVPCLLSPGQQIQHNAVTTFMVSGHPNTCNEVQIIRSSNTFCQLLTQ